MAMDTFFASSRDIFVAQPGMIKMIKISNGMNLAEYVYGI